MAALRFQRSEITRPPFGGKIKIRPVLRPSYSPRQPPTCPQFGESPSPLTPLVSQTRDLLPLDRRSHPEEEEEEKNNKSEEQSKTG